jgi:hypothetical protein
LWSVGVVAAHLVLSQTAGVRLSYGLPEVLSADYAPFGYGLVSCPFKAEERVRLPHGVPVSGSSVVQSAVLIQRRPEVQSLPGQPQISVIGRVAQRKERPLVEREATGSSPVTVARAMRLPRSLDIHGELAQLGERLLCKQEARGSTPLFSTRTDELKR